MFKNNSLFCPEITVQLSVCIILDLTRTWFSTLLFVLYVGYQPNGKPNRVQSPVDQLFPLSEELVQNVEVTLRRIVQKAIEHSLFKFPSLKQAVEVKVVSKIFDKKRNKTIKFIRQFLEMQKKSIDLVYAPVPTPREISLWEDYRMNDGKSHPCMTSKTMSHMKDLADKLYPEPLVKEIVGQPKVFAPASFANSKVSIQQGRLLHPGIFPGGLPYEVLEAV